MRGAAERGGIRRRARPLLWVLPAIALGAAAAFVFWPRTPDGCRTIDRRLGVDQRSDGWTAEARYQRWFAGERCHGRVVVALYAPGGTWEDEALEAAALVGVDDVLRVPGDGVRWEGDVVRLEGHALEVQRLPGEEDPGEFAWRQDRLAER